MTKHEVGRVYHGQGQLEVAVKNCFDAGAGSAIVEK